MEVLVDRQKEEQEGIFEGEIKDASLARAVIRAYNAKLGQDITPGDDRLFRLAWTFLDSENAKGKK